MRRLSDAFSERMLSSDLRTSTSQTRPKPVTKPSAKATLVASAQLSQAKSAAKVPSASRIDTGWVSSVQRPVVIGESSLSGA